MRATKPHRRSAREVAAARPPLSRWALAAYLASWVLCGPVFIAWFNLPLSGLALGIVERFYLLPLTLLALPLALGLDSLFGFFLLRADVAGPLGVGLLCLFVFTSYPAVREHHQGDVEQYLTDSLASAEARAVILGTGDHRLFGFRYVQRVLGLRPDVTYVDPLMLHYPWYHQRIEAVLGFPIHGVSPENVDPIAVAYSVLISDRELYVTDRFSASMFDVFPSYPIGTLIRVLPPSETPPPPRELEQMNSAWSSRHRRARSDPRGLTGWAAYVREDYDRPWRVLAEAYEALGLVEDAARCRDRSTQW